MSCSLWAWCYDLLCGVTGLSYHAVLGLGRGDLMALSCWAVWCGFGEGHGSSVVVGGYDLGVGLSCMVAVFLEST